MLFRSEPLLRAEPDLRPTHISADLAGLLTPHSAPKRSSSDWVLGSASACVTDETLKVRGAETEWENALRCACQASWSAAPRDLADAVALLESHRPAHDAAR